jgi:hypothetical protein
MAVVEVILDTKDCSKRLQKGAAFVAGNDPLARECLTAMGGVGLTLERNAFEAHSKPSDEFWAKLGVATVILRKGGQSIFSDADVEAKRATTPKMRDSQLLLDSLTLGAANNVFEVEKLSVAVGTADPRAAVLHNGGETDPFVFDSERRKIFNKNVPAKRAGSEMSAQRLNEGEAAGAYSRYKVHGIPVLELEEGSRINLYRRTPWKKLGIESPWNPYHFLWRGIFRKWEKSGRRGTVPARPIIVPLDDNGKKRLMSILRDYVRIAFGGHSNGV